MKKIISLLIAMVITFTFCGCRDTADISSASDLIEIIYIDETGKETVDDTSAQDSDGKASSSSKPNDASVATPSGSNSSKNKATGSSSAESGLTDEQKLLYKPTSVTITLYNSQSGTYGVTWNTQNKPDNPVIQICEGENFNPAAAKEFSVDYEKYGTYSINNSKQLYYVSKGVISLSANKTYTYRAYDKAVGVGSNIGKIKTHSANTEKFSFVHVSDSQTYDSSTLDSTDTGAQFRKTLTAIKNLNPDFILHTGDMVEYSKYEDFWNNMINYNWEYYMSIPFMTLSGNHETSYRNGSNETFKHFNHNIPDQIDTTLGFFYSFDYGNARFIMLNTNRLSSNNYLTDDQFLFLKSALENNNKKWTIVAMHNPMYSVGAYGTDTSKNERAVALKNQLTELFANNGVDLVLQGHDHQYFKSYPIKAVDTVDKSHEVRTVDGIKYDVNPKGTIYAMSGAAGNQNRGINTAMGAMYQSLFELKQDSKARSYSEIQIDGNRLTVNLRNVDTAGNVSNVWSYGIIKE